MKSLLPVLPVAALLLLAGCTGPGPSSPEPVTSVTPTGTAAAPAAPAVAAGGGGTPVAAATTAPKVVFPDSSPACTLTQRIGLTDVTIKYSRPGIKGRVVFGGIIPYGYVWRTGANSSTKITFSTDVRLEGHDVPQGTYALYSIPNADSWTIILDRDTSLWGAYNYDQKNDFLRFDVTPTPLGAPVETFTIEFANIKDDSANLDLLWEKTLVKIRVETDVVGQVRAQIEAAMADPAPKKAGFYYNAGMFYVNHGPDLDRALAMADQAIALANAAHSTAVFEPEYLKAKVLILKGDKAGAAQWAQLSRDGAVRNDGPNSSFIRMNDDILAQARE